MENSIKKNLLSNNETLQFRTILDIHEHLKRLKKEPLPLFIESLINFDITWILCDFLAVTDINILRSTLSCLGIISENKLFYTKNVASQAIIQIQQNCYQMSRTLTKDQNILGKMILTLATIINRANGFNIDLKTISNIHQLLEFINYLNIENSTDMTYILAILHLYAAVSSKIDDIENENVFSLFVKLQQDILTVANILVQRNIEPTMESYQTFYFNIMKPIVAICYAGIKLCENDDINFNNSPESTNEGEDIHTNRSTPVVNIICKTMLNSVIPNAKMPNALHNENDDNEVVRHLVCCLSHLYTRRDINLNKFSFQLLEQGYLKYLFQFRNGREGLHECICDCIAHIITDLSQFYLALDKWSDGPQGFRRFIKSELLSSDFDQIKVESAAADAYLILCYFHYLITRDHEILNNVKALPLMTKIINMSADNLPEIPILQIVLFLFAATALENPTEHLDKNFPYALVKIIEILDVVGLENCYTNHPILPCFVLQNSVFPVEIRHGVIKLWLKSEDNICQLVSPGRMQILIGSLLNIIQTGAEDIIVERAMDELSRMISDSDNCTSSIEQQITQVMWENLPHVLADFMNTCENNIYKYLMMLTRLSNINLSILLAIRCSNSLITAFDCENLTLNSDIKTLIVKQISKMLSVDVTAKDGRVVSVYTNNNKILNKLCANAFSKEHNNLSAACYKCLADILHSQKQLSIKCTEPVSLRPMDLFNALLRKAHVYFDVMGFLNKIWIGEVEYPAILRPVYTEKEAKDILTGIYRTYINIHLNCLPYRWEFTFLCLSNFLIFCRKYYDFVLYDCCDYLCNHSIIIFAISYNYYGDQYLKFANTWLKYGLYSRCSFVVDALEAKSHIDKRQEIGIYYETSFEEALRKLNDHIQKLIALGSLQANNVKELQSTLSTFI